MSGRSRIRFPFNQRGTSNIITPSSSTSTLISISETTSTSSTIAHPPLPPLPPGDKPRLIPPGTTISPFEIRDLNSLIRQRYALDVGIWLRRDCEVRDRHLVLNQMRRSDATLRKIIATLQAWDRPEVWENDDDWHRLKLIRKRIENEEGKRAWAANPPWAGGNSDIRDAVELPLRQLPQR